MKTLRLALAALFCAALTAWAVPPPDSGTPPTVPRPVIEAPVLLDGSVLFPVQTGFLSFSATERAAAISARIAQLAADAPPVAVTVREGEGGSEVVSGELVLMTVTDADAAAAGVPRAQLASARAATIGAVVAGVQQQNSQRSLLTAALTALGLSVALLLVLLLLKRGVARVAARIEAERGRRLRTLRLQNIELLGEERIVALLRGALRWLHIIVVLVLLDLYLTNVLRLFPWTRGFAERYAAYIMEPLAAVGHAIVAYLPNVFFIAVIVGVTTLATKVARLLFAEVGRGVIVLPGFHAEWAEPTFKILRFLIIAFAAVVIFPYLPGSSSPAFQGISVFLGVLLSLGSSSAVANIVAGVILTYTRAFSLGDRVQIADTVGDVVEKTLLVTRVRTIKNVDVTIPNSLVLGSHVVNYSSSAQAYGLILHTTVTIGYDAPWRQVHELLIAAAKRTAHVLPLPVPFVLQTALNDFYVSYELNAYTDQPQRMAAIYAELHQQIQDCFNEAGVEIMSPHFGALRDGNPTTIPAQYLAEGYRAPRFGVRLEPDGEGR